jgi:ABC-2 type transport system ATP-binding protein
VQAVVSPEATKIIAPMADADGVTDLLIKLRNMGIHLTEMGVQKPTLDEVFFAITGHGVEEQTSSDGAVSTVR